MVFTLTFHEKQLWDAGTKLSNLQLSTAELLPILQQIGTLVWWSTATGNISNSESLKYAMHPVRNALIAKRLLSHPNVDVNISVACCICEVIRTVVGYEPYNNEQMRDFFELVVITFEKVSSASRGRYTKMTRVLEQLSVGKFPVLMCDLQLDGLIVHLFTQFLTAADFNTTAIVLKMKKIMTVIIKESRPLNSELGKLIVRCVRRENQIPSSKRLGGDVLKNCAAQLKPHLPDRMVNEVYNFLGETIPSTTHISNLRKDATHKRKLECQAESSNMVNPIRRRQDANRHTDADKVNNSLGGTISTTSDRFHMLKLECQEGIRNTVQPVTNYQHGTRDTVNLQGIHSENERTRQFKMLSFLSKQLMPPNPVTEAQSVVGSRIKIWSHKDEISYGVVKSYDCMMKIHKVLYDNGYEGFVHLEGQKWELVENVSVTPDSLGQARPNMASTLQSDKVFVQGYKVSNNIAPILKAIFIKHGDIAAECVCKTASVRSSLLKVVCKVVTRIQTSDVATILSEFKEIERQVLDAEETNINVSWLLAHMEAIQKRNEAMENSTLLMEMKVNTILVKRAAQIDLRERGTKLEAAEKLFEEAERYHQGVVTFFDGRNKRHKLLYDDGDEALLNLERDQWELVQNVSDCVEPAVAINVSSPQSGITCVQGYKVKNINAPILEAIFKKHGDIASDCVFKTASVIESILEVVCDVVRKIQTNDVKTIISEMEEIESQVSGAEANKINVSWLRAHLESIHKRNEVLKKYSMHIKMKENTSVVTRAAKMDLDQKQIELLTAQQCSEEAERCVKVLHLVEQKLNDNILESKAEENKWVVNPII